MKTISIVLIIGLICTNIFAAVSVISDDTTIQTSSSRIISLDEPVVTQNEEYVSLQHDMATSYLLEPGEPALPVFTETFVLPFQSWDIQVDVAMDRTQSLMINDLILPSPKPVADGSEESGKMLPDMNIYGSTDAYPQDDFNIDIKIGLLEKEETMFGKQTKLY